MNDDLSRRITFRIMQGEWERLERLLKKSRHRSMSELLRAMLFRGRLTIVTHDSSLDLAMEQLSAIRTELHRIGVNINQAMARLYSLPAEHRLEQVPKMQAEFGDIKKNIKELMLIIKEISYRWLPE